MMKNVLNTDLSGKVAVVTGAGGVLCGDFAKVLARAGASVALLDINEAAARKVADEISAEGGIAKAFACTYITAISTGLARIILWDAQAHNAAKTPRKPIGQNIIAL